VSLTDLQIDRYSRQIILRELGGAGQQRLLAGRCLVVGSGPAVDTAITYLAGAGVGAIDLARLASASGPPWPSLGYAPLSERGPDTTVRDLGDCRELATSCYDAILFVDTTAAAGAIPRCVTAVAPRSGWVAAYASRSGAVDLAVLPSGASACIACARPEPVRSAEADLDTARDAIAWSLAGALASLTLLRWIAAIAPEASPHAVRLAPGAPAWAEVSLSRRTPCPRGCSPTA
jgi:hypothetical protein